MCDVYPGSRGGNRRVLQITLAVAAVRGEFPPLWPASAGEPGDAVA